MLANLLYKLLTSNDPAARGIVAELAQFQNAPAIFTGGVPEDAPYPAIVITELPGEDWGCRANEGGVYRAQVQVFDVKEFTYKDVRSLAMRVRELINRNTLDPFIGQAGYENWGLRADPPGNTNDGLGFPGFTLQVSLRALKKSA